MGAVLLVGRHVLRDALATDGLRYVALAVLVGLGLGTYGAAVLGVGALRPTDIRAALRRGR